MIKPAPTTGIATSAPGYSLADVRATLAVTIAASPSQERNAASQRGRPRRRSLPTAMSPPRASSQARVSGEKKALDWLADVNTIENAYEATITVTSRIAEPDPQ